MEEEGGEERRTRERGLEGGGIREREAVEERWKGKGWEERRQRDVEGERIGGN